MYIRRNCPRWRDPGPLVRCICSNRRDAMRFKVRVLTKRRTGARRRRDGRNGGVRQSVPPIRSPLLILVIIAAAARRTSDFPETPSCFIPLVTITIRHERRWRRPGSPARLIPPRPLILPWQMLRNVTRLGRHGAARRYPYNMFVRRGTRRIIHPPNARRRSRGRVRRDGRAGEKKSPKPPGRILSYSRILSFARARSKSRKLVNTHYYIRTHTRGILIGIIKP